MFCHRQGEFLFLFIYLLPCYTLRYTLYAVQLLYAGRECRNVAARSQLRSARRHLVVVPRYSRSTYGRRAFSVAGPMTWNSLADSLRDPSLSMIDSFRRQLKTFLFYNNRPCVFSALEIFLLMRYISRRFTYLLTYS